MRGEEDKKIRRSEAGKLGSWEVTRCGMRNSRCELRGMEMGRGQSAKSRAHSVKAKINGYWMLDDGD